MTVYCTDLRVSNIMELNTKDKTHADSTVEASLSQNDLAGRQAALSFSGEEMTKAAAKRYLSVRFSRGLLSCITSDLAEEAPWSPGGRSHQHDMPDSQYFVSTLPQVVLGFPRLYCHAHACGVRCAVEVLSGDCLACSVGSTNSASLTLASPTSQSTTPRVGWMWGDPRMQSPRGALCTSPWANSTCPCLCPCLCSR